MMNPLSIRATVRGLVRQPLFSWTAILLTGLTAGSAFAIVALLRGVLFTPLPFAEPERLVSVCERHERLGGWCAVATPTIAELSSGSRGLAAAGAGRGWVFTIEADGEPMTVQGGIAGPGFFEALGIDPLLGRLPSADEMGDEEGRVVLLGHGLWTRRFGGAPDVLGRVIALGGDPHTIIGVLPPDVQVPDIPGAEMWRPLHFGPEDVDRREWRGFVGVARLADGVELSTAETELRALYERLDERFDAIDESWSLDLIPLVDRVVGGVRAELWTFGAAVLLFVLIGAANVLNLYFFRGIRLRDQDRIRHALGASTRDRFGRRALEGTLVGIGAAVVALMSGGVLLFILVRVAPPDMPRLDLVSVEPISLLSGVAIAVSVSLLAAMVAAQVIQWGARPSASSMSGGRSSSGPWVRRVRSGLVATEAALALLLVTSGAMLVRSFHAYGEWDPGFEIEGLAAVQLFASTAEHPDRESVMEAWRSVEEFAASIPGVGAVATVSAGPLFGGEETDVYRTDPTRTEVLPSVRWYDASPGYFAALGRPFVAGRDLRPTDALHGERVAVINETLASQAFGNEDPVGRVIELPESELSLRVVGVVADIPRLVPGEAPQPEIFWSNRQLPRWGSFLVVRLEPGTSVPGVEEALGQLEPSISVGGLRPLEERFRAVLVRPRFLVFLIVVFASMATILAAGGLFAVLSVSVAERMRELGIRVAFGARRRQIIVRTLGSGLILAALGAGVGVSLHLAVEAVLVSVLPGLQPAGPLLLLVSMAVLLAAAFLAAGPPAWRAGNADPVELLRRDG